MQAIEVNLRKQIPHGGIKRIVDETKINHITVVKVLNDFPKCNVRSEFFTKIVDKAHQIIKEDRERIDRGAAKLAKLLNETHD